MSIEVQSVTKSYGNQLALNEISFSANKGEIIGFLGPNGAGKSTMMKIITGFISLFLFLVLMFLRALKKPKLK